MAFWCLLRHTKAPSVLWLPIDASLREAGPPAVLGPAPLASGPRWALSDAQCLRGLGPLGASSSPPLAEKTKRANSRPTGCPLGAKSPPLRTTGLRLSFYWYVFGARRLFKMQLCLALLGPEGPQKCPSHEPHFWFPQESPKALPVRVSCLCLCLCRACVCTPPPPALPPQDSPFQNPVPRNVGKSFFRS